ncbi:phosphate acyltransferase PlsX [Candidatus Mesenet endosymbiont of Phosphuga atrata]|uniref:phosphate acyltransferase PlsX n=1 Tax=Candidatus Mesenet endosymbiont of Phosphuga atrata TaxID=3066221 RepID=UPI0030CB21A1
MGGDFAPLSVIKGVDFFFNNLIGSNTNVSFHIYGQEEKVLPILSKYKRVLGNSTFVDCMDVILSDDKPSFALRQRKKSSMYSAIEAIKDGTVAGVVSSGNTGALMAIARFVLGTLPNIYRPAIASVFPTKSKDFILLDLGANVDCNADSLFQFAVMGSAFAKTVLGRDNPKVALLNIGTEEIKGTDAIRKAFDLLKCATDILNFKGYIEASEFLNGDIDVIVADGFVGNVMLKAAETMVNTIISLVKDEISSSFITKLFGFFIKKKLSSSLGHFNPKTRNGAMFLGLNGVVIKSHGNADNIAFGHAIKFAVDAIRNNLNAKIISGISSVE